MSRNLCQQSVVNDNIRNGKTAAFKVADLGSNPCSPANMNLYSSIVNVGGGEMYNTGNGV